MFQYLGTWNLSDGAVAFYNVTFYSDSGVAHTVVVDTELPTGPYAGGYACDQPVNGVLCGLPCSRKATRRQMATAGSTLRSPIRIATPLSIVAILVGSDCCHRPLCE